MQTSPDSKPPSGSLSTLLKVGAVAALVAFLYMGARTRLEKHAREKQAMEEMDKTRRDMGEEMKRELDQNGTISADTASKAMDKMRGQIDRMAAQGGKDDKQMKVVSEVMGELQAKAAPYIILIKRIETEAPMDMTTVKTKDDLAKRRSLGKEMIRLNQDIMTYMNSVESKLRDKLRAAGATGPSEEEFVKGFMKGFSKSSAVQRRVRKSDETIANVLISMTDLLDAQWGKWKAKDGNVIFEDPASLKRYNELLDETAKAADEQAVAQRELIELQQRR